MIPGKHCFIRIPCEIVSAHYKDQHSIISYSVSDGSCIMCHTLLSRFVLCITTRNFESGDICAIIMHSYLKSSNIKAWNKSSNEIGIYYIFVFGEKSRICIWCVRILCGQKMVTRGIWQYGHWLQLTSSACSHHWRQLNNVIVIARAACYMCDRTRAYIKWI